VIIDKGLRALGCALALLFLGAAPVQAAEVYGGLFKHDVTFLGEFVGLGAAGREGGSDLHLGLRSDRLDKLRLLGRPQAHVSASFNSHNTSNWVAAGLDWPIALSQRVYFRPGFGLAYTDGAAGLPPVNAPGISPQEIQRRLVLYNTRIDFGSKVLFNPEVALGVRFNDRWAVELSYTHLSNGQIFHTGKNQGLDDAGMRLVYSF
jgi:lipid A 3-O-deacylase